MQIYGAAEESTISVSSVAVSVNEASKLNIIDSDSGSQWSNNGTGGSSEFTLTLPGSYNISKVRYWDDYTRPLTIEVDGVLVSNNQWTSVAGGFSDITPDVLVAGSEVPKDDLCAAALANPAQLSRGNSLLQLKGVV